MSESTLSTKGNSNKSVSSPITSKSLFSFFGSHSNHSRQSSQQLSSHGNDYSKKDKIIHRHSFTPSIEVKETNTMYKDYDPNTGNKIINKYMLVRELGRGVHGKVKLGKDMEFGEWVVRQRNDLTNEQKIRKEIAILKKCIHPHVVRLKEVIDDPMSRKIYMVIEYMEGGEIQWKDEYDRPIMSVERARQIFRDVVLGLEYLHHQGIIHRDIKPANLLLTGDNVVKISDFGVSHFSQKKSTLTLRGKHQTKTSEDSDLAKTAGSPAFFAPELCFPGDLTQDMSSASIISDNASYSSDHSSESNSQSNNAINMRTQRPPKTKAIDIWALGVTLYCFIFGRCPFIADTEFELFFNVIPKQPLGFPEGIPVSDDLRDLLMKLLEKNPKNRITLEEVKKHPWVVADIPNPEKWREETDPKRYKAVTVTDEEVKSAYTLKDRLKKKFRKISLSLGNLTIGNLRKRSKSISEGLSSLGSPIYSHKTHYQSSSSPINILPSDENQTLQVAHQRHQSLYGSSFPEIYARQKHKDIENYVDDDTNSQQWDKAEYYLSRNSRQFAMKRLSNNSHSSLSKSWIYDGEDKEENIIVQDKNIEHDSLNHNKSRTDNGKNKYLMVINRPNPNLSNNINTTNTLVQPSQTDQGLETTSRENIEILDTMDSDEEDGVVFGANASRGWYTPQVLNPHTSNDPNNSNNSDNVCAPHDGKNKSPSGKTKGGGNDGGKSPNGGEPTPKEGGKAPAGDGKAPGGGGDGKAPGGGGGDGKAPGGGGGDGKAPGGGGGDGKAPGGGGPDGDGKAPGGGGPGGDGKAPGGGGPGGDGKAPGGGEPTPKEGGKFPETAFLGYALFSKAKVATANTQQVNGLMTFFQPPDGETTISGKISVPLNKLDGNYRFVIMDGNQLLHEFTGLFVPMSFGQATLFSFTLNSVRLDGPNSIVGKYFTIYESDAILTYGLIEQEF
ncbi:6594_t:CDS:10 [Funneliformis mosseae]|uniref:6594_t:CDS:1 n=1 Tax=Funneliformis mosseae TaxID=27381 RepID=A0A9N9DZ38_FUNMO|nr:6594_t:CDS:10 [Funneliformis mosseae]